MKHILCIDDKPIEVTSLKLELKDVKDVVIHWLPTIADAINLLSAGLYDFAVVTVDVMGTTINQSEFENNIDKLQPNNIIVTSGVVSSLSGKYKFSLKSDLAKAVRQELKK